MHAEAFGEAQEHDLLGPMVEHTRANFQAIGTDEDVFKAAKLTADSGFHTEANMQRLFAEEIDAYVADRLFRQRDPRFVGADRYKQRQRQQRSGRSKRLFSPADFVFAKDLSHCICPAGKRLYRSGGHVQVRGSMATKFKAPKSACLGCALRSACLRHPERTEIRQVAYFHGRSVQGAESFTARMQRKIDSTVGRALYSLRVAIAEPPFAHICRVMGLDRFTLRGKIKVNIQWKLFCIVHNLKKAARYGPQFA